MEWTGMMELRRPMRIFKVKGFGSLADRRPRRERGMGGFPIDLQSDVGCLPFNAGINSGQQLGKIRHPFPVSRQSLRGCLMRPFIQSEGSVTSKIEVQRVRHVHVRYPQLYRAQFRIKLSDIDYESFNPIFLDDLRQGF